MHPANGMPACWLHVHPHGRRVQITLSVLICEPCQIAAGMLTLAS